MSMRIHLPKTYKTRHFRVKPRIDKITLLINFLSNKLNLM